MERQSTHCNSMGRADNCDFPITIDMDVGGGRKRKKRDISFD